MFDYSSSTSLGLTNGFGIYVHIPFCVHRCSYCDFYSSTRYESRDFEKLAQALCAELRGAATWLARERGTVPPVSSVFFGGGTPSLMPVPQLREIVACLTEVFPIERSAEITLEANPETVSEAFSRDLRATGFVNRVSLGAQSFQSKYLSKLERLGSSESIARAVERLRAAGFTNLNLDLIFGIPGQNLEEMRSDIRSAAALGPQHLSAYNLTLKPGHPLFGQLPGDDESADLYERAVDTLSELGYEQYEISNYALPGFESQHNLLYWNGGDFLGVGPSAASRFFWEDRFFHRKQVSDFAKYLAETKFPGSDFTPSSRGQTVLEASFLELRTNRGVDLNRFQARYHYDLRQAKKFGVFRQGGFLSEDNGVLKLSAKGRLLADSVTSELVDLDPHD